MSGIEIIALSAALGAGVGGISAANRGGNPLEGALLGGATGAAGGALGGALAPAAATGGSIAGGSAAQAFPVAMDAAIAPVALDAVGGSAASAIMPATAEWAAPHLVSGSLIPDMAAMDTAMSMGQIAQTAGVQPPASPFAGLFKGADNAKQVFQIAGDVAKSGQQRQEQQMDMRPPQIKQASAPQIAAPITSLLQERERMPRRRISLL